MLMIKKIKAISLLLSFVMVLIHMMVPHHHHELMAEFSKNKQEQVSHAHHHGSGSHHHHHDHHHDTNNDKQNTDQFLGFLLTGHTHTPVIVSEYYFSKIIKSTKQQVKAQKTHGVSNYTYISVSKYKVLKHQITHPPPQRIIKPFLNSHFLRGPPVLV